MKVKLVAGPACALALVAMLSAGCKEREQVQHEEREAAFGCLLDAETITAPDAA